MKSILKLLTPSAGSALRKVSYPKGHILLQPGDISDKIWFVEDGLVREFFTPDKGRELTAQIVTADTFIYSPLSYLNEEPSRTVIEVIEKCRVIPITRSEVTQHFLRAVLEQTVIRAEKRFEILRLKRPTQRLEAFERLYPELCNRIPLYYVASLLNITPQTLSRIRSARARPGPLSNSFLLRLNWHVTHIYPFKGRFYIEAAACPVIVNFHPISRDDLSHFSNFVRFNGRDAKILRLYNRH